MEGSILENMVKIKGLLPVEEQFIWLAKETNEILKEAQDAIASRKLKLLKYYENLLKLRDDEDS